jgi:lysophospholipase L1-like esterase
MAALTVQAQTSTPPGAVSDDQLRIVAFGDSTTATRGKLPVYAGLLETELPAKGLNAVVINAGIGGHSTRMGRGRFERDVLAHRPALVIIQFGINDAAVDVWKEPPVSEPRVPLADYRSNLEFFIDRLRAAHAKVVLMTPNPTRWTDRLRQKYGKAPYRADDPDGFNTLLRTYAEAVRQVAREKKVELVDVYAEYQSFGAREGQSVDALLLDGMHPNEKGHRLVADLLLARIPAMLKQ